MKRSTKMLVLTPWVRFGVCVERRLTTWPLCVFPMRIFKKKKQKQTQQIALSPICTLYFFVF